MADVTVTINGRSYPVVCEDGKEDHLQKLAAYLDQKLVELAGKVGNVGDMRLMVLAALTVADELADAYDELALLREGPEPVPEIPASGRMRGLGKSNGAAEEKLAASLDALAERIEALAARIEAAA